MNNMEIFACADNSLLKLAVNWQQVKMLSKETLEYQMASVCIPPFLIQKVKKEY